MSETNGSDVASSVATSSIGARSMSKPTTLPRSSKSVVTLLKPRACRSRQRHAIRCRGCRSQNSDGVSQVCLPMTTVEESVLDGLPVRQRHDAKNARLSGVWRDNIAPAADASVVLDVATDRQRRLGLCQRQIRALAHHLFGEVTRRGHSSPILNAAMNASWGMLTLPYSRIRFFPSFCFSSSFFLRLASPP